MPEWNKSMCLLFSRAVRYVNPHSLKKYENIKFHLATQLTLHYYYLPVGSFQSTEFNMIKDNAVLDRCLVDVENFSAMRALFGNFVQKIGHGFFFRDQISEEFVLFPIKRYVSYELSHVQSTKHSKKLEKCSSQLIHTVLLVIFFGTAVAT